jgi:peroxiredoxin (alkyl hydroperoxide reductase subunit C)
MSTAKVGQPAPDFTAPIYDPSGERPLGEKVSLTDYRGTWLVFFWYPLDFTFVCPTEITALSDRYEDFADLDTEILGASTDSVHSHKAWANTPRDRNGIEGVRYPIIADMLQTIAADYGVLVEDAGIALRGLFIIDPQGVLQYSVINNLNIGRSVDETLRVLQALQTGGLCPSDWKPGQKTLA